MTGLAAHDLLEVEWEPDTFRPCYFVAVDHAQRWIVVSIRGTVTKQDVLTDVCSRSETFLTGHAHSGIAAAAQLLHSRLAPVLADAFARFPTYRLVTIGHSLGAGTASLLAMLLRHDTSCSALPAAARAVECFAFAPPALATLGLALECEPYVTTVVNGYDIVPRLCVANVDKLVWDLNEFGLLAQAIRGASAMLGGRVSEAAARAGFSAKTALEERLQRAGKSSDALFPPGRVYQLWSDKAGPYAIRGTPPEYGTILVSTAMIADHLPDVYSDAVRRLLARLEADAAMEYTAPDRSGNPNKHL